MTLKPEEIDFDKEWSSLKQTIDKVINVKHIDRKGKRLIDLVFGF